MLLNHAQEWGLRVVHETPSDYVIGIDEVGLGACAGPLVVCGAVFPKGWSHLEVKDSKQFTGEDGRAKHAKRMKVLPIITAACVYYKAVVVPVVDIDSVGMGPALEDAMRHVALCCTHAYPESVVAIDGDNVIRLQRARAVVAIPKGDVLVPAISAASIIAKTGRDALMIALNEVYPGYDLDQHMGYGTPGHLEALTKLGVSPIHRRSYKCVQEILEREARPVG